MKRLLSIPVAFVLALAQAVAGLAVLILMGIAVAAVLAAVQYWFMFALLIPFVLPLIALYRLLRFRRKVTPVQAIQQTDR